MNRVLVSSSFALVAAVNSVSFAGFFNDSANVNVLRQYGPGDVQLVTHTNSGTGVGFINRDAPNDGAQWNTETGGGFNASNQTITQSFALGGPNGGPINFNGSPVTIGSYSAEWDGGGRAAGTLSLEYSLDNATWFTADAAFSPAGSDFSHRTLSAGPVTASYVRYNATNTNGDTSFGLTELRVYAQTGQNIRQDRGYNILHDLRDAGKASVADSSTANQWIARNGGSAAAMSDDLVNGQETKSQSGTEFNAANNTGVRSYLLYHFDDAYRIDFGTLGGSKGQGWHDFEIYAMNGNGSLVSVQGALDGLSIPNVGSITGLGWVLQNSHGAGDVGSPGYDFSFATPGSYTDVLVVWDGGQGGGMRELQLFAIPEPASMSLLGVVMLGAVRRRSRV